MVQRGDTGERLSPFKIGFAFLIAWAAPVPLGYALTRLGNVMSPEDGGIIFGIGYVMVFLPILSWAGLLPGTVLHVLAWRQGYGGLGVCVGIGLCIGLLLSTLVGPLAYVGAAPLSAVYWIVLRYLHGHSL